MATSPCSEVEDVRLLDVDVDHEDLEKGVYQVLAELRSSWKKEDIKRKYIDQNSAHANRTFVCYVTDDYDDAVVFRVKTDRFQQFVDRDISLKSFLLFNEIGVAPKLLCRLKNGLCCEYIKGKTFSKDHPEKLKDVSIAKNVAKELAKIHAKETTRLAAEKYEMTKENAPWKIFNILIDGWSASYTDKECQEALDNHEFPTKEEYLSEKTEMEKVINDLDLPFGFCHNDSGFGNVIFIEEKDRVVLIDYDVCGYNYYLLDLAHYTVGASLGYPKSTPTDEMPSLFPPEQLRDICRAYLETLRRVDSWDRDVMDEDVERLYVQLVKTSFYFILYVVAVTGLLAGSPNVAWQMRQIDHLRSGIRLWNWYKREKERVISMKVPDVPPIRNN